MAILSIFKRSIRTKFIFTFFIVLLVLSIINFYFSFSIQKKDSLTFAENHLKMLSEMLAFSVGAGLSEDNYDIVETAFNWAKLDRQVIFIDILDETNSSLVTHNPAKLVFDVRALISQEGVIHEADLLTLRTPIEYKEKRFGFIIMSYSLKQMNNEITTRAILQLIIVVIIFTLGLGIVFILSKMLTKQITLLKEAAVAVGNGDLHVNIKVNSEDEVGQLADSLKTMVVKIKDSSELLLKEKSKVEKAMNEAEIQKNNFAEQKNYLTEKVDEILEQMSKFANGDLTVKLKVEKDDAIGRLYSGLNKATENIKNMIFQIMDLADRISTNTGNIVRSAEDMANGAESQSSDTMEVAGAVEQMTKTILETSRNALIAADTAKSAGNKAKDGGIVVDEVMTGMNRISNVVSKSADKVFTLGQNSDKIGEIVQVINEIAEQTNLLALNAAIEAARAGEQGRGFAVVADEVRKLAEKTTKATKEIAEMIKKIQKDTVDAVESMKRGTEEVETGKKLTEKAGIVLNEIVQEAHNVNNLVNQVAAASEQQSSTSKQISNNVEAISRVTDGTVRDIQNIAISVDDLDKLANGLKEAVLKFNIRETQKELST